MLWSLNREELEVLREIGCGVCIQDSPICERLAGKGLAVFNGELFSPSAAGEFVLDALDGMEVSEGHLAEVSLIEELVREKAPSIDDFS